MVTGWGVSENPESNVGRMAGMKRLLEYLRGCTAGKIDARRKALLFWTGVITLCANGYAFVNYMPLHDAINHMFSSAGEWEV